MSHDDQNEPPKPDVDPSQPSIASSTPPKASESHKPTSKSRPAPTDEWLARQPSRPSFFPEETLEQSRAFLEDLVPSMRPTPIKHATTPSSGTHAATGQRFGDHSDDDISSVVLVHSRDDDEPARKSEPEARQSSTPPAPSAAGKSRALTPDDGALAALRTLPRRKRRDAHPLLWSEHAGPVRASLLSHMADHAQKPAQKSRLYMASAELHADLQDHAAARVARAAAHAADPNDMLALRAHRRTASGDADHRTAIHALQAEVSHAPSTQERVLLLCHQAEHERVHGGGALEAAELIEDACAFGDSLLAQLLRAELNVKAGRYKPAALALAQAAQLWSDPEGAAALLVEAGRLLERSPDPSEALAFYARASAARDSVAAALGAYRACRATGELTGAQRALVTLTQLVSDPRLLADLQRQRARLAHDLLDEPARAVTLLESTETLPAARTRARAAEAVHDEPARNAALQAWTRLSGGSERALGFIELGRAYIEHGRWGDADEALHEAARSGAPGALLGLWRAAWARGSGDNAGLAQAALGADGDEPLRAAAKLATDPSQAARELELLIEAATNGRTNELTSEVLALDAAAENGDRESTLRALQRSAANLSPERRSGPLLAALDLQRHDGKDSEASEDSAALLRELHESGRGVPVVLRSVAARLTHPASIGALWLEEAQALRDGHTEQAAFAATLAGRYLEAAGADASEAYVEALDAVRGYLPACFALEAAARKQGDLAALERAHRELVLTTSSQVERAGRCVRLALLCAQSDPETAAHWLSEAAQGRPRDIVLADLQARLALDRPADERLARARAAASLETEGPFGRALQLSAAAAHEDAGQWHEAIDLYRARLETEPGDDIARLGYERALHEASEYETLIAETERKLLTAQTSRQRGALLETLAKLEAERGATDRATAALETALEADDTNIAWLRELQRIAMQQADVARLLVVSERLAELLSDERERSAELRLALRLEARLQDVASEALILSGEHRIKRDLWYALELEASALRNGDRARFYEAASTISDLLEDPLERATYALRAAEAFEVAAPSRAASELADALLCSPEHPLAVEQLGRLYRAAGDMRAAAETWQRAAAFARSPTHAAELMYAAAVLFQDELSDRPAALAGFLRVLEIDVLYADAFARAHALLGQQDDKRGLIAILERRLSVPAEPALAAQLQAERARLHLALGEHTAAQSALQGQLNADPNDAQALRTLAELYLAEGQHKAAADALIQLARLSTDFEVLGFAFYELGVIYQEHLPDPRRAEIAFTRVIAMAPNDVRSIERLVALWQSQSNFERAARALRHLTGMTEDLPKRQSYLIALAETIERTGDMRQAEQTLDEARQAQPGNAHVLQVLAAFYGRQADKRAYAVHLVRSCHALRTSIEEAPSELESWHGLIAMLEARERHDAAVSVANTAVALGLVSDELLALAGAQIGLGPAALGDAVRRRIAPRGALESARAILQTAQAELAPFLPCEAAQDAQPNANLSGSPVALAVQALFGLPALQLLDTAHHVCMPAESDPLRVLVARAWFSEASDAEQFFLLTRAVAVANAGLLLAVRATPLRSLLVLHAVRKLFAPTHSVAAIEDDELNAVVAQLKTALPDALRARLAPLLEELFAQAEWNPRRVAVQAFELGSRLALCVTGNIGAAVDALLRLRGHKPTALSAGERLTVARTDPHLRALLSFAISEAYLEARRELNEPRASLPPQ